ncbi:MAG: pyrroloquinoline quinone biosynthesis protein PqqE, partial [Erysipelotrichaceae bacterium]|nr:pyrroloquinoline quinone biosynthesis protein PqqE [Erysipelotrichaceae bacterium]
MASMKENISHAAERQAVSLVADQLVKKVKNTKDYQERSEVYLKIVDMAEKFYKDAKPETFERVRKYVSNPDNRWMKMINSMIDDADPHYAKMMLLNLGYESFFRGTKMIRENRQKYNCNIPWLILFDPTSACNMHCIGCWSGTYGHKSSLTFDEMDKI